MTFFITVITVFLAIFLVRRMNLKSKGYQNSVRAGEFIGGHPDISKVLKHTRIASSETQFAICNSMFKPQGYIEKSFIKDVIFENATTFEKRVTATRLLTIGIFAFARKKNSRNENAYMIIEWNDGKFSHSTSFLFEGKGSTQRANKARNWLIKELR